MPDQSELHDELQNLAGKLKKFNHGVHPIELTGEPIDPGVAEAAWLFREERERLKSQGKAERRLAACLRNRASEVESV